MLEEHNQIALILFDPCLNLKLFFAIKKKN